MDRIYSLDGSYSFNLSGRKKTRKKQSVKKRTFTSLLRGIERKGLFSEGTEEHGDTLEEYLDEVYSAGDSLKDAQTLENIKQYKGAVRAFLSFVVDKIVQVEKKVSKKNILTGKQYVFTRVKIVDRKLEQLVSDVLISQTSQLQILQKIDEINGLLINLLT